MCFSVSFLSAGHREVSRLHPEECPDSVHGVLLATEERLRYQSPPTGPRRHGRGSGGSRPAGGGHTELTATEVHADTEVV